MELFASMDDERIDGMGDSLDTSSAKSANFQMNYQNPTKRKEAYLDHYVHNHPAPSWGTVAVALTSGGLYQQANMVQNTYIHGIYIQSLYVVEEGGADDLDCCGE